jgi:hypothetical protein
MQLPVAIHKGTGDLNLLFIAIIAKAILVIVPILIEAIMITNSKGIIPSMLITP